MKKQSLFSRLMQNSYLLFAFALVISLVVWIYMSFNSPSTETSFTIGDVPIQIELAEEARNLGLRVFTADDTTATVTVSGTRTVLGLVNENDLNVTAASGAATTTGNFTFPVTANKRSSRGNYQITGCTPSNINVTVDYLKESEFEIVDGIVFYVQDGYYGSSSLPYISEKLVKSRDVEAELVLLDEDNNEISQALLTLSVQKLKVTVNVMPEKKVSVVPDFINKPEGLVLTDNMMTVSPTELVLAGPAATLNSIDSVTLDPIDFTKIKNDKIVFEAQDIIIPENCKNISNYATAKVTLDLSGFSQKTFTVDRFVVEGLSKDYTSEITTKSITVTIIGPKEDLESISASQITGVIDTSNASGKTGSVEMPVTFRISGSNRVWAYGTYQANVTITKKK